MKNILNHNGTSQLLLANVDDGTNRIIINGEELDPTYWVGENSYVILIDGTPIGIRQISSNSGNIMMRKVSDAVNEYQLVRQSDALCYSHVGQIIESTKLATLEDVQAIYGSDTTWIQHSGYILRGASSGVTDNNAVKDGGEDTHTLTTNEIPAHTHGSKTLTGSFRLSPSVTLNTANAYPMYDSFTGICSQRVDYTQQAYTGTSVAPNGNRITGANINATHEHDSVGGGAAHNIMQSYKNVYIWERVS